MFILLDMFTYNYDAKICTTTNDEKHELHQDFLIDQDCPYPANIQVRKIK